MLPSGTMFCVARGSHMRPTYVISLSWVSLRPYSGYRILPNDGWGRRCKWLSSCMVPHDLVADGIRCLACLTAPHLARYSTSWDIFYYCVPFAVHSELPSSVCHREKACAENVISLWEDPMGERGKFVTFPQTIQPKKEWRSASKCRGSRDRKRWYVGCCNFDRGSPELYTNPILTWTLVQVDLRSI